MITINFLKLIWIVFLLEHLFFPVVSACTWPTALQDGVWLDSDKGSLTFNATHMIGWRLKTVISSSVVTDWVCQNSTGDFLVARASNNIDPLKSSFIAFLCLKITQISNYSFYYYQHSSEQPNSNYERFEVTGSNAFTSFISNLSNICIETPATSEFHMLLKRGFQNEAKVYCPEAFLGMFSYSFNNGSNFCGNHNELWDVCSDRKVMTFNYIACTALIAYSELGTVYCVNSLTSGTYYYASVYNTDTAVNKYRFTCLMGSLSGNNVYVSQSPNSCTKTQNTKSIPVAANGTSLGAYMNLTAYNTCRFDNPSTSTSTTTPGTTLNVGSTAGSVTTNISPLVKVTSSNVSAIVGGTVGGLLFLIALGGTAILICLCVKKKTPPEKPFEESYTNRDLAKMNHITPYTEDHSKSSFAKVNDERNNYTWKTEVITSEIVEENKTDQKTLEKIHFTDQSLFLNESTVLGATQQPPMETAYRQKPTFDRFYSTIVLDETENVPDKLSNTKAPDSDENSSSVIMTTSGNITSTKGNAGYSLCRSHFPLSETSHTISISKEYHEDETNHFTSNVAHALPLSSTFSYYFLESDIAKNPGQEHFETDSTCESENEEENHDAAVSEKCQTQLDKSFLVHRISSIDDGKKFANNAVLGFDKHGRLTPLGFESPSNKSPKRKRRSKKNRKKKHKKSSVSTMLRLAAASAGSKATSSDFSIFVSSVEHAAQKDSLVSDNGDLKGKDLLGGHLNAADPESYIKDIKIGENRSPVTNPVNAASTGLAETVSLEKGPVNVEL